MLAALGMLGGCTPGADARGPAAAASGFGAALGQGQGGRACALLLPALRRDVERSAGRPCALALGQQGLPAAGRVVHVDTYGHQARVQLQHDTVFLALQPGGWQLTAAGCSLPGTDQPYDCTLGGS